MKQSAGILLYQVMQGELRVLLVHPGGPFWAKKDDGAWTIPKGEPAEGEELLQAARREFFEETGFEVRGDVISLSVVKQKSGKLVHAWAAEGELDVSAVRSNTFDMEWPPRSGKLKTFPEIDRAQWFSKGEALVKIIPAQQALIAELENKLAEK